LGARDRRALEPVLDPKNGRWRVGFAHGGVHALEALVMARYYMFTQVYFNETSKVMELHFAEWLRRRNVEWPSDPEAFLEHDDLKVLTDMRQSDDPHARAIVHRERFSLAHETAEHLSREDRQRFLDLVPTLKKEFGDQLLIDNSTKDPHRLEKNRVWVRRFDGSLQPISEASDFIGKLSRIECFRVYSPKKLRQAVHQRVEELLGR
ncbi:MAG: hypothetical protein AAFY88_11050, partial [Acidobacteriota bacterium]